MVIMATAFSDQADGIRSIVWPQFIYYINAIRLTVLTKFLPRTSWCSESKRTSTVVCLNGRTDFGKTASCNHAK